ncbi:hypothetical protein NVV95_04090 [Herbiconiux sp. CPCC 205716]|uniref:Uncharacterized protein n=1 Tax=Herbiconiux gentiana TaxID=2970912 RepID=A0ABT2GEL3_9MICO|nr:hypothetical protein [Herbiconiux gentiana]MCS5713730.1 hypothetical protein [Herbiconiux gentiana]
MHFELVRRPQRDSRLPPLLGEGADGPLSRRRVRDHVYISVGTSSSQALELSGEPFDYQSVDAGRAEPFRDETRHKRNGFASAQV